MIQEDREGFRDLPEDNGKAYQVGYFEGLREGVTRFAWWKDGTQYVGTCGRTLADELAEIDEDEKAKTGEVSK